MIEDSWIKPDINHIPNDLSLACHFCVLWLCCRQVRNFFTDLEINTDSLHYSVGEEGRVDFDK